jgi:hypothetical protein
MRLPLLVVLAVAASPLPASAQLSLRLGAGATLGNSLVSKATLYDDVVSLKTGVAPTLLVGVGYPIAPRYQLVAEARLASGSLTATTEAGESDLGSLRTTSVALLAEGPLPYHLRFQVGGGVIKYSPAEAAGVFADDAPMKPMVTAGLGWVRTLRPGLDLTAGARWDLHEFTTDALQRRGWSLAQRVHRLAITVGIARGF